MPSERPVFYYDLGSPYAWLAAERVHALFDEPPVFEPVLLGGIFRETGRSSWGFGPRREEGMRECERRAAEYGLLPVRWPERWPGNMLTAMRAATFAKQSGRAVAFSLAAFRQQFNAGRTMDELDNVLLAAAACELHPNAVKVGIETRAVAERLAAADAEARERGVGGVPTVRVGDQLFEGDARLEDAAAAMTARAH